MPVNSVSTTSSDREQLIPWGILAGLLGVLIWSYWNSLTETAANWENPKYSHGYLVPAFTLALLYLRYQPIRLSEVTASARWTGVAMLAAGLGFRVLVTYFPHTTPEMYSFIPCVAGLFLAVGGWRTARWAWPAIGFLFFMYPLPAPMDKYLLGPLQSGATAASTYCLQTMGVAAVRDGNNILINQLDQPLGVEEACSGLRMLTIFMALAVALTLITDRPIWERIVIVASAIPIALAVNIARITLTACLYMLVNEGWVSMDKQTVDDMFHMMAGWLMMPMALGLLFLEFQILVHLFVEESTGPLPIDMEMRRPGVQV